MASRKGRRVVLPICNLQFAICNWQLASYRAGSNWSRFCPRRRVGLVSPRRGSARLSCGCSPFDPREPVQYSANRRLRGLPMPRDLILGTAGHIDHGKTSLVKALTGVDCDRLPEEKRRGITIDIGFAALDLGDFRLGIVDVPGHERFIKNMLAGATGVDLAVLVVAADDSVMPQTREHLEILQLLGLRHGVVALTKCDTVDETTLEVAELEI